MSPDKIPESIAQLIELAASYAEVARTTGATQPIASLADELVDARRRLTIAAAPPAWSLERAMRNAAVRLWLAGEAHDPEHWQGEVANRLPDARRAVALTDLSRSQAAALAASTWASGLCVHPRTELLWGAARVVAFLVAGLDRPAASDVGAPSQSIGGAP